MTKKLLGVWMLTPLCPPEFYSRLLNKLELDPPACFKRARWHFAAYTRGTNMKRFMRRQ